MTHSEIKSEDDFMFTHTWIADDHMGVIRRHVRVFGETEEGVLRRMGHKFRLRDDDGKVYFHGYAADSSSFEPLDYALPRWGTTDIQYQNPETNEWESL